MNYSDNDELEALIPSTWNERKLLQGMRACEGRPSLLTGYKNSVMQRFIVGQDVKTAERRTAFLQAKLKELELTYSVARKIQKIKSLPDRLEIDAAERDLTLMEIAAKKAEAELRIKKANYEGENLGKEKPDPGAPPPEKEKYKFEL